MSAEIGVVAIAEAKPGHEAEVAAAIRPCVEATRREKGCLQYTAHTDVEHPSHFVFVERWESREALSEHMKTPHFLAMAKSFEGKLQNPLTVLVLKELE